MNATWKHPELGRFEFDEFIGWKKAITMPAFAGFVYDNGAVRASPAGMTVLAIEANNAEDRPSKAALALAGKTLANQEKLAAAVTAGLWDDFNGRGPDSGMWWHGDLLMVIKWQKQLEKLLNLTAKVPPLVGPDVLKAWMRLSQVLVRKRAHGCERPVVELSFEAAFELEHGVGVLTDGDSILGTGYQHDVGVFGSG